MRWTELRQDDPLSAVRGLSTALTLQTDELGELAIAIKDANTDQSAHGSVADLLPSAPAERAG